MLKAVLNAPNDFQLVCDADVPTPGPGEVLLRIEATTLCGTDLRLISGAKTAGVRPGVVMGHEIAGRIEALGEGVGGLEVGRQATVSIVVSCRHCRECLADREHLCENLELFGYGIDGGFQEHMLVPSRAVAGGNVIQTPQELPATALALSEPLSCVLNAAGQVRLQPGDTVVVLGAGPIGLLHTQVARACGATQVVVTNRSQPRLDAARRVGATHTVNPTTDDLDAAVRDLTGGAGADVVIVAIGDLALANQALAVAANGARVNFFAGFPKGSTAEVDVNLIHYKELIVTGGSNARRRDVLRAVRMLSAGQVNADEIVTHTFPLERVHDAVAAVRDRLGVKIAVCP